MRIKKVGIVGMGALGILYGALIQDYVGKKNLTFIMDADRFAKYGEEPVNVNGKEMYFKMSTPQDAKPLDLIIVATKNTGLNEAIEEMKDFVDEDTIIISVLNGITSEEILAKQFGKFNIIYTVAQGMDAIKLGKSFACTKPGELHIGMTAGCSQKSFEALCEFFDDARIKYVKEDDIVLRMWKKFMLNCGINQVCMAYGLTYGEATEANTEPYNVMVGAMNEVMDLANRLGHPITSDDVSYYVSLMRSLGYNSMPSMAQDRLNKKKSELDSFAGTVISLAEKNGIDVPVNRMLYKKISEIESAYTLLSTT